MTVDEFEVRQGFRVTEKPLCGKPDHVMGEWIDLAKLISHDRTFSSLDPDSQR